MVSDEEAQEHEVRNVASKKNVEEEVPRKASNKKYQGDEDLGRKDSRKKNAEPAPQQQSEDPYASTKPSATSPKKAKKTLRQPASFSDLDSEFQDFQSHYSASPSPEPASKSTVKSPISKENPDPHPYHDSRKRRELYPLFHRGSVLAMRVLLGVGKGWIPRGCDTLHQRRKETFQVVRTVLSKSLRLHLHL
ncbi:hypothetical protein BCR33DRAFT_36243 [Rhizoclosmatium globosum]|uniref:Uncharacterized protein n=1 Tax=Rhizoclosmatium globosum TaxID=329046 RepID=A0A1Y2CN68_9FUNG|nr:hypothetical protein BCR33DRAFT_36243 [Rhizoclosmatium globosum]|eukprot:ORY48479.1 hypothetical protein BCR33DRAFT_36243 [Rhizoclosmatium globosum]